MSKKYDDDTKFIDDSLKLFLSWKKEINDDYPDLLEVLSKYDKNTTLIDNTLKLYLEWKPEINSNFEDFLEISYGYKGDTDALVVSI